MVYIVLIVHTATDPFSRVTLAMQVIAVTQESPNWLSNLQTDISKANVDIVNRQWCSFGCNKPRCRTRCVCQLYKNKTLALSNVIYCIVLYKILISPFWELILFLFFFKWERDMCTVAERNMQLNFSYRKHSAALNPTQKILIFYSLHRFSSPQLKYKVYLLINNNNIIMALTPSLTVIVRPVISCN